MAYKTTGKAEGLNQDGETTLSFKFRRREKNGTCFADIEIYYNATIKKTTTHSLILA